MERVFINVFYPKMAQSAGEYAAPQSGAASEQECLAVPGLSRDIRSAVSCEQVLFHFHSLLRPLCGHAGFTRAPCRSP